MKKNINISIHAFTLVELVLVITIVVILSAISGPIYESYAYKARQAEGYALIGTIRSAQEQYFNERGVFLHSYVATGGEAGTCNELILGIDARPNKYYTKFNVGFNVLQGNGAYDANAKVGFKAIAYGNGAANVTMIYNLTTGVTMG